jgi:DNA-directed RNA polymerase specialized sigma24 family protein
MAFNLTKAICRYKQTGRGLDAIMQRITVKAYTFARQNHYCCEDDYADFLLTFYPRIDSLIKRYRMTGMDFEAYLQSCLIWHMKSYLTIRIRKKRQEMILYNESCEALIQTETTGWEVHEANPEPFQALLQKERKQDEMRESLKILLLALKCANEINDNFINKIASRIGMHSAIVFHLIEIMRTMMRNRTKRIQSLQERRRRNYFRLRYFLDMRRNCVDKFQAEDLDKKICLEQTRYEAVSKILAITPKSPSHNDIARILGLPKGTIDSVYYYIRRSGKKE